MNQQPTAEDWIIMRLLDGWVQDTGGLNHNMTACRTVHWMVKKLGRKTVHAMIDQLNQEREK